MVAAVSAGESRPAAIAQRFPWWECEDCAAHFKANRDGVIHAAASVGIERGLTSNQALDAYYKERHEQHA